MKFIIKFIFSREFVQEFISNLIDLFNQQNNITKQEIVDFFVFITAFLVIPTSLLLLSVFCASTIYAITIG